jgi:Tol biopolymer transport system component
MLVCVAGCDGVFGLHELHRADATIQADASIDAPSQWQPAQVVTLRVPEFYAATDITLTADETRVVYTAYMGSEYDIYEASMTSATVGGSATLLESDPEAEVLPEMSPDGLTLYFMTHETPGVGAIHMRTRNVIDDDWGGATMPPDLNRPALDDRPGSPDASGTYMVIARAPVLQEMQNVGGTWTPIDTCDAITAVLADARNPHLSPDGLRLVFAGAAVVEPGGLDLYMSTRNALGDVWSPPTVIDLSQRTLDDTDPWLSADGMRLWWTRGDNVLFAKKL